MRYLKKRRHAIGPESQGRGLASDPMDGVANLFDVGLVFIVGLIVTLFSTYRLHDLFNAESEMTIVKKTKDGEMEIITKKKEKIDVLKVSKSMGEGEGQRMGVAYRLEDGSMVYVPDGGETASE
ncbi:DUF2149 domain-containing protein [Desulfoluna sp.]|uniref:DUF2149 domain-containing protein n=1 Tax=Desulfoluna sp. TaxID=2045199 RepID=UPI0026244062|nr:DUF2149 domain-containing protein [Desulfoluna sp.]